MCNAQVARAGYLCEIVRVSYVKTSMRVARVTEGCAPYDEHTCLCSDGKAHSEFAA